MVEKGGVKMFFWIDSVRGIREEAIAEASCYRNGDSDLCLDRHRGYSDIANAAESLVDMIIAMERKCLSLDD